MSAVEAEEAPAGSGLVPVGIPVSGRVHLGRLRSRLPAEFLQRIAWANQTAREIVNTELIYIAGEADPDDELGS